MSDQDSAVALLYADVSGSMDVFRQMGDLDARRVIRELLAKLGEVVKRHDGRIVKTIGDELMCAFATPGAAAEAAIEMQRETTAGPSDSKLALRIGFHFGPAIAEEGDYYGHTVNLAARVAGLSNAGRILTTRETYLLLPRPLRANAMRFRPAAVKGVEETVELYQLLWRDGTEPAPPRESWQPQDHAYTRLRLTAAGVEYVLEGGTGPITIGRDAGNRIVVADALASAHHAKIELRGGVFVLTDSSSNGTYISFDGGAEMFKTGRELHLRRSGRLWFGRAPDDPDAWPVNFIVE